MTDTLALLDRLIGFETVSDQSNLALMDFVADHLCSLGFRVTPYPHPAATRWASMPKLGRRARAGCCCRPIPTWCPSPDRTGPARPFA